MKLVPKKIKVKLSMYDWSVEHVVIGGRVSNFPVSYDGKYEFLLCLMALWAGLSCSTIMTSITVKLILWLLLQELMCGL